MADELTALELATGKLLGADGADPAELGRMIAERGAAIDRLSKQLPGVEEAERIRAELARGEIVVERLRARRAEWREELERVTQIDQYRTELGRGVEPAPVTIDIAG